MCRIIVVLLFVPNDDTDYNFSIIRYQRTTGRSSDVSPYFNHYSLVDISFYSLRVKSVVDITKQALLA